MTDQLIPEHQRTAVAGAKRPDGAFCLPDVVRVPCNGAAPVHAYMPNTTLVHYFCPGKSCARCGGRGWVASQDLAVWLDAALGWLTNIDPVRAEIIFDDMGCNLVTDGLVEDIGAIYEFGKGLDGLVAALARALVVQGARLMIEQED